RPIRSSLADARGAVSASELEPRNDLAVALAPDIIRVDIPKPTAQFARRVSRRRCSGVAAGGLQIEPVEDVEELRPDIELHLLLDGEAAAQAHVLCGLALPPVVVVEAGAGSELPCGRIHPGGRVQNQVLSWVDAFAIGVFQEQRLTGDPVHARALKDQRTEVIVRSRRADN